MAHRIMATVHDEIDVKVPTHCPACQKPAWTAGHADGNCGVYPEGYDAPYKFKREERAEFDRQVLYV